MTKDETMILDQLVAASKIIHNKPTNATNNNLKEEAWQTLTQQFNSSVTSYPRSPSQLRLKWEYLKKSARKRCAYMRRSLKKTGGGIYYFPPNDVLDTVISLLGNTCQGFTAEFGGDTTQKINSNLVLSEVDENIQGDVVENGDGLGDSDGGVSQEVLKEIQQFKTPPPKHNNFF